MKKYIIFGVLSLFFASPLFGEELGSQESGFMVGAEGFDKSENSELAIPREGQELGLPEDMEGSMLEGAVSEKTPQEKADAANKALEDMQRMDNEQFPEYDLEEVETTVLE